MKHTGSAVLLIVLAALWVVPLLSVVGESDRTDGGPHELDPDLIRALIVSVVVSGVASVLCCTFGTMAGYAMSKKRFYGKKLLFGVLVGAMFFPPVVLMAPLFKVTAALRIYDTLAALILPSSVSAFAIVYMKAAIDNVPSSILDAAKIDGVGEVAILTRVLLPLVRRPLVALLLLQFIVTWGALAVPMAVVDSPRNYTLALRLAVAARKFHYIPKQEFLWIVGLIAVPAIVLFLLRARDIMQGAMGALFRYEKE